MPNDARHNRRHEGMERHEAPGHAIHGGDFYDEIADDFSHLERRGDVVNADVLDAWFDPSPRVLRALSENLNWLVKSSPPTHAEGLRRAIAEARTVPEECVLPGGGSSQLIYAALPQLIKAGSRALLLEPTYGEYSHLFENILDLEISRHMLSAENGFAPDIEHLCRDAADADLIVIVNPNSPTGHHISREDLLKVVDMAKGIVWLDETYIDYVGSCSSLEKEACRRENLIICKSMSKFYALSGLRAGYLVGSRLAISQIEPSLPPWSVGTLSQFAAIEALRDRTYYDAMAKRTRILRGELAASLKQLPGIAIVDSVTNFILVRLPDASIPSDVVESMRKQGVYVRDCTSFGPTLAGRYIRIAVKSQPDNERIVDALRSAL